MNFAAMDLNDLWFGRKRRKILRAFSFDHRRTWYIMGRGSGEDGLLLTYSIGLSVEYRILQSVSFDETLRLKLTFFERL